MYEQTRLAPMIRRWEAEGKWEDWCGANQRAPRGGKYSVMTFAKS
ncbi:MAG: hypothetical protein U0795_10565 [Pirellulales bacterium]